MASPLLRRIQDQDDLAKPLVDGGALVYNGSSGKFATQTVVGTPGPAGANGPSGVVAVSATAPLSLAYDASSQTVSGSVAAATPTTPGVQPLPTLDSVAATGATTTQTIGVGGLNIGTNASLTTDQFGNVSISAPNAGIYLNGTVHAKGVSSLDYNVPLTLTGVGQGVTVGTDNEPVSVGGSLAVSGDITGPAGFTVNTLGQVAATAVYLTGSDGKVNFGASVGDQADTGLARHSAETIRVTDGGTGRGNLIAADVTGSSFSFVSRGDTIDGLHQIGNTTVVGGLTGVRIQNYLNYQTVTDVAQFGSGTSLDSTLYGSLKRFWQHHRIHGDVCHIGHRRQPND